MNILISGGSRGIGAACVKLFSEKGHNVAFIYNKSDECALRVAAEYNAVKIKSDISDFAICENTFSVAESLIGEIDVLVNCAGISYIGQICDTDSDIFERVLNTNLTSTYALSKAASISMVERKKGNIINVGSVWGRVGASCETAYSASKGAVRAFTRALAKELAPSNIRVNCVEPGVINTDMNRELGEDTLYTLMEDIPLSRLGEGEDVAKLIYFLASEDAAYITGQVIGVDGGFYL